MLALGGDFGTQTNSKGPNPSGTALMYNALATIRYQFSPVFSITTRGEVFQDRWGFISGLLTTSGIQPEGLQLWGLTLGSEYSLQEGTYLRGEVRYIDTDEALEISYRNEPVSKRWEAMITLGYTFDKLFRW